MLSNRTSRWSLATAALCVALIAASWFLLIGPRRSQASELAADQVTAQQQNDALRQRIAQLQAQMADLPQRQAELASIRRQLPAAPNVPRLVRDLRSLADASGVTLGAVTPADPVVLDATTGQPVAGGAAAGTGQLFGIPTSVKVSGDYFEAALFVKQVQTKMRRAYLITGVSAEQGNGGSTSTDGTAGAGSASGTIDLTLTGQVFVYRDTADAAGAAAVAQPGAASSGTAPAPAAGTSDR